jgi:hypothetical protein
MKQLIEYKKNGYEFKLVKREGPYAIFLGTKPNSISQNYEVIRVLVTEAGSRMVHDPKTDTDMEITWEAHERPPGDNEWGTRGWTYGNSKEALAKFNSLVHP